MSFYTFTESKANGVLRESAMLVRSVLATEVALPATLSAVLKGFLRVYQYYYECLTSVDK